jgi:hypothetical protein
MKRVLVPGVLVVVSGLGLAKLPPQDDATKAKAAEAAAKTAWQGKVDAYRLCKIQDKVAAAYHKTAAKSSPSGEAKPAPGAASATATSGTPVAATPPPPCADPGPFAYNQPEQKPLETSGAHSPAGNATSPPSVKPNSAEMAPKK